MSIPMVETFRGQRVQIKVVDQHALTIRGRAPRIATVRDEPYTCIESPETFIQMLKDERLSVDVFTFMQELADTTPRYSYHMEWDAAAVVPVTTYDQWWKKLDYQSRNKARKAEKSGVELKIVPFDDALVAGISGIYNETPIRQGKRFWHYQKDLELVKQENKTFLERSTFIGAFRDGELIGFAKLVRSRDTASLMQILSKMSHRDKAPSNALIARSVALCAEEKIPYLHYGVWSQGGLGTFKTSLGFVRREIPRYFVPLNLKGHLCLRLKLHHKWTDRLPQHWTERLVNLRNDWNLRLYGAKTPSAPNR